MLPTRQQFAENLRRQRKLSGLTQEQLADACELHPTSVGLLERQQRSPRLDTIVKLSRALELQSIYELVRGI